jgi:hypothetical protein
MTSEQVQHRDADGDEARAARLVELSQKIRAQVGKIIVGQDDVIEQLLIAILARGHCLLEGVPGLAKTLMVRCLAESMSLSFHRIQFTPDLMPADITGTDIIQEDHHSGHRDLVFEKGPVFTQMLLADEINRTPPKTQAALLEAMQEHAVTVGGKTYVLEEPFFVLATQNPIEQEGTYPLPEAQRDRFLFNVIVDYPDREHESEIIDRTTSTMEMQLESSRRGRRDYRVPADRTARPSARPCQGVCARSCSCSSPQGPQCRRLGAAADRMGTRAASQSATGAGGQGAGHSSGPPPRDAGRRRIARVSCPATSNRFHVQRRSRRGDRGRPDRPPARGSASERPTAALASVTIGIRDRSPRLGAANEPRAMFLSPNFKA